MNSEREQIYSRIKAAVGPLPKKTPLPDFADELVKLRQPTGTGDLWESFAKRLKALNGVSFIGIEHLAAFLREKKYMHGYCDPALLPFVAAKFSPDFQLETVFDRTRVDDYQFGITRAQGAIAETGTIVLADKTTSSRLAALAPWVHIAALKRSEIFPDIPAAIMALGDDPNIIWATGPSRTADVEGILIEGVHGPGIQIALLLD